EPLNGVVGAMNVGHRVDQIELARGLRHGDAILFGASAAPWRRVPLTPTLKFGEGRRLAQPRGEREKKRVCFRADSERRRSSGGESAREERRELPRRQRIGLKPRAAKTNRAARFRYRAIEWEKCSKVAEACQSKNASRDSSRKSL